MRWVRMPTESAWWFYTPRLTCWDKAWPLYVQQDEYDGGPCWKTPYGIIKATTGWWFGPIRFTNPLETSVVVCIDFDGTLVDHQFPDIGKPVPGAFRWLKAFQEAGAKLILWTMRSDGRTGEGRENGPVLSEAVEFCRQQGIEFWGINENPEQKSWTNSPKQYAHYYVDDAAACCPLRENPRLGGRPYVDWEVVGPWVLERIHEYFALKD